MKFSEISYYHKYYCCAKSESSQILRVLLRATTIQIAQLKRQGACEQEMEREKAVQEATRREIVR